MPRWAGALGDELARLLMSDPDLSDELRREEHSIRLRREALRTHGVAARWEQLGAPAPAPPLTSVLLATRRADMVGFALDQVGRQRGAQLEVILALHGVPAGHPDVAAAIAAFDGPLTVLEADPQAVFGEVLNEAAARASGSFLLKMDDDDWYGPDFLADLLLAHSYSGAQVVGTVPEFVYLSSIDVTVHRKQITEQITSFVAGGTILVERSAFQAVGGFRPLRRLGRHPVPGGAAGGGRADLPYARPRATSCAAAPPPTTPGRSRSARSCSATGTSGAASAPALSWNYRDSS